MAEEKKERKKRVVKIKCAKCGKQHLNDSKEIVRHSNRYYCVGCMQQKQANKDEWTGFLETAMDFLGVTAPTGLMIKQIKEYTSLYGYTYPAMHYTLWYCKEIEMLEVKEEFGLACIKFYYDKARRFYEQQERIGESVTKATEVVTKVVNVDLNKGKDLRETKIVDYSELL